MNQGLWMLISLIIVVLDIAGVPFLPIRGGLPA
jgi:hypothetical protein